MRQSYLRSLRIFEITRVLVRYRLDELLYYLPLLKPYQALLKLNPARWVMPKPEGSFGARLRLALETLGPTFIKLGQMLSTRRDLLPEEITRELAKLQDAVPPFPSEQAWQIIAASLRKPVTELFAELEAEPAAAASIAQVHFGRLLDGREVAIKIRRPGLRRIIDQDLGILAWLAELAERYSQEGRRLRVRAVVSEYAKTLRGELDFLREAANASQLRRNFAAEPELLYIPEIFWDYCSEEVLVMERIRGIQIGQLDALRAAGINFDQLSRRAAEIFFARFFAIRSFMPTCTRAISSSIRAMVASLPLISASWVAWTTPVNTIWRKTWLLFSTATIGEWPRRTLKPVGCLQKPMCRISRPPFAPSPSPFSKNRYTKSR